MDEQHRTAKAALDFNLHERSRKKDAAQDGPVVGGMAPGCANSPGGERERNGIGAGYVLRPSTRTNRIAALEGWRYWRRLSRHLAVPVVRLDARHRGFLQCAAGAIQMASARNIDRTRFPDGAARTVCGRPMTAQAAGISPQT